MRIEKKYSLVSKEGNEIKNKKTRWGGHRGYKKEGEVLIRRRAVLVNQGNNCEHDGTSECHNMHIQLENSTLAQKDYETGNWKELKEEKKQRHYKSETAVWRGELTERKEEVGRNQIVRVIVKI